MDLAVHQKKNTDERHEPESIEYMLFHWNVITNNTSRRFCIDVYTFGRIALSFLIAKSCGSLQLKNVHEPACKKDNNTIKNVKMTYVFGKKG